MSEGSGGPEEPRVSVFAPGSVGNLGCGFDVLGLALEGPGDRVTAGPSSTPGVHLRGVSGDGGALPRETEANAAGVAARCLLARAGAEGVGVALDLSKGLPLSGGMGGSAASAAAAVTAVDALLELGSTREELLDAALEGERAAAGAPHPDNVAPSLLGGLVLARPRARRRVTSLPVPEGLSVALLHQDVRVETRSAREAVGSRLSLEDAVQQWGNTAALVAALYSGDWDLLGDAVEDRVAEPHRAGSIPGFEAVRVAALKAGAVAFGISGAGPSVFALCRGPADAAAVGEAMTAALELEVGRRGRMYVSRAPAHGARIVDAEEEGHGVTTEVDDPWS